jgi:sugar lactone lactonase YvrE
MGGGQQEPASDVELVLDAHAPHGEGPVWLADERVLLWLDISDGLVNRFDPATGRNTALDVGQPVGAVAPRSGGGLIMALRDGFATLDARTAQVDLIVPAEQDKPGNRMNDGKCDAAGRFWAGTMAFDAHAGAGALYRLGHDQRVETVLTDVTISNGLCWSLDDRTMYFIDSGTLGVDAFDYDPRTGAIANRRRVVTIPEGAGLPDGMTIDREGYLWVALWGGWAVHRYTPEGQLDRVVRVPAAQASCPTFGGPHLDELYITTAAMGVSGDQASQQPHAGGLFRYRPGVAGFAPHAYRG